MMSITAALNLIERIQSERSITDNEMFSILSRCGVEPTMHLLSALNRLRRASASNLESASKEKAP